MQNLAHNLHCNHSSLFSSGLNTTGLCQVVEDGLCDEAQKIINFLAIHWCEFNGNHWITIPFSLIVIFLIFKYISITVEEYIADALQSITEFLGMSDSLAAVTLLAFANGAADMMTVLIASESEGGISYNIGSLYGGGLFVCSAVMSVCILESKHALGLNKMIIYRLIVFYIITTLITIAFAAYKWITWWESLIILGVYFLVVVVVTIDDRIVLMKRNQNFSLRPPTSYIFNSVDGSQEGEKEEYQNESVQNSRLKKLHDEVIDSMVDKTARLRYETQEDELNRQPSVFIERAPHSHEVQPVTKKFEMQPAPANLHHSFTLELKVKLNFIKRRRKRPLKMLDFYETLMHMVETPFIYLLYLTILPCDDEQYSKMRCLLYPIPGMLFNTWVIMQEFSFKVLFIGCGLGFLLLIFFVLALDEDKPPRWLVVINTLGLAGGMMWTYVLVGTLIDIIECSGIIYNLNKTFLGLTVLAIGSSIPDALTTITLCKQRESIMAISGAYAGQLFALTVAFGISMLKLTLKEGPQPFDLFDLSQFANNLMNIMVIFTSLFVLILTFVYTTRNSYMLTKNFGIVLMLIYVAFMLAACVIGIRNAILTY